MGGPVTYARIARLEQGDSIRQLATRSGLSYGEISLIETGRLKPTDQQLAKLAAALNITRTERLVRNVTLADVERVLEQVPA